MTKLTDENINTILDNITPEICTILADKLRGAFQNQADENEKLQARVQDLEDHIGNHNIPSCRSKAK